MSFDNGVTHEPCPKCGSSNNLARWPDGHAYCFSDHCGYYEKEGGEQTPTQRQPKTKMSLLQGDYKSLKGRGITEETCRKFGYQVGKMGEDTVHIAPYRDAQGAVVAQKVRGKGKKFKFLGEPSNTVLFGQHLWGEKGKKVVVCEGEIDTLTVSQLQGNKWPVVGIQNGAQAAKRSLQKQLEWLSGFDEVILMFDMDEPGRHASQVCAELFKPGQCKIATLPKKDPNECLQANLGEEVIKAIWNAKTYRPDGIVDGAELWDVVSVEDTISSVYYPFEGLNEKTRGLRKGELVTITAGSGVGKSALVREIAYHLISENETVGMMMLEENTKRTALGLMGVYASVPLHLGFGDTDGQTLREAFDATVGSGYCYLYDHFGSTEIDNLVNRVRYMVKSLGCDWVILDHLSIVVSGLGDGDERRLIDNAMTLLRTLVEETGCGLILVSHLKRPGEGKGHEEGAKTSLSQLRGSHAIAQLSDIVIGLERNQQGDTPNMTTVRILKNRYTGETGMACILEYCVTTGRLRESLGFEDPEFDT